MTRKRYTIPFFIVFSLLFVFNSRADTLSIADAGARSWVAYTINGTGGHWGECMQVELHNQRDRTLHLVLEAGSVLMPEDSNIQRMLVTKTEYIHLQAGEKVTMPFHAMCASRFKEAPGVETFFDFGDMAENPLADLAILIHQRGYQNYAAQHAVWSVSDNLPLENIHSEQQNISDSLRAYVAAAKNIEIPWYSLIYSTEKPFPAVNKLIAVTGTVEYYIPNNAMVSVALFTESGKKVKTFREDVPHHPESYGYYFEMDVRDMPKERYYLTVVSNDQVIKKLWMDLPSYPENQ